jgi:hypothetical protein
MAAGLSLWLAALACVVGCTIPILANAGSINATYIHETKSIHDTRSIREAGAIRENSAQQDQPGEPDLMAGMANCPHHSGGNAPVKPGPAKSAPTKPNSPKPVPGGAMSCCPVEVTVASKPDTVRLQIAPAGDSLLAPDFRLMPIRFSHSVDFVPPAWQSGRDTLLETHLLRV